jgi:hypothetical protein
VPAKRSRARSRPQITQAKGHYVLAVKENLQRLADALRDFFATLHRSGYP